MEQNTLTPKGMDGSETHTEQKPDNKNTSSMKTENRLNGFVVREIRPIVAREGGLE